MASILEFDEAEWRQATLDAHNEFRALHGAPPLEWSDECAEMALEQAEACEVEERLHHGNFEGPSGRHGQNAYYCSTAPTPAKAVSAFYNEIAQYDYGSPGLSASTVRTVF